MYCSVIKSDLVVKILTQALAHWSRGKVVARPRCSSLAIAALDRLASASRASVQQCARLRGVDALSTSVPYIPP